MINFSEYFDGIDLREYEELWFGHFSEGDLFLGLTKNEAKEKLEEIRGICRYFYLKGRQDALASYPINHTTRE